MIQLDLPMPKHCGMCPCYDPHLRDCRAIMFIDREVNNDVSAIASVRPFWCPLNEPVKVESNVYDIIEEHHNCLVQILRNSVTNEISFGWKKEDDKPPKRICDCYHPNGYCLGTKEMDECGCGGDESKCDFYDYKRRKANDNDL